jgi:hypothetical protein
MYNIGHPFYKKRIKLKLERKKREKLIKGWDVKIEENWGKNNGEDPFSYWYEVVKLDILM